MSHEGPRACDTLFEVFELVANHRILRKHFVHLFRQRVVFALIGIVISLSGNPPDASLPLARLPPSSTCILDTFTGSPE